MPGVLILGGGLAGLSAAAALGGEGIGVTVLEARPYLGGRASSYPLPAEEGAEVIDNCQHVLLGCCVNLLDFYSRLGVAGCIRFHSEFHYLEPGGRRSVLCAGALPAPLHFSGSFLGLNFLGWRDKLAVARAMLALSRERHREDLDRITMLDWLRAQRQTPAAIERFWRPVLVSAINEELDRMAAAHGFQVFRLGFLARREASAMGVPDVPLGELYGPGAWQRLPSVALLTRMPVTDVEVREGRVVGVRAAGRWFDAAHYISALPFERLAAVAPALPPPPAALTHSPITGIHLWFDRPVTDLPHAALLDRTIQWFFNKGDGKYLLVVVSASRQLTALSRQEVIGLALGELGEFLPAVRGAVLVKAHVVKEQRATFSACPGLESLRPAAEEGLTNLSLAGDWTRSGWPATMEGAVRSGYLAAEAACRALGMPRRFLKPDIG